MKRAHQLQPLSRQHHLGLNLSHHAKHCSDKRHHIDKHWQKLTSYIQDMSTHFQIEDHLIATALKPYQNTNPDVATALETLNKQHLLLLKLICTSQNQTITAAHVKALGTLLYDHIRFEERILFPLAETYLTTETLDLIYQACADNVKRIDETR